MSESRKKISNLQEWCKLNNPDLIGEWNYQKNGKEPCKYAIQSHAKVWWKCKKGHEWDATVGSRTYMKSGCPYCNGKRAIPGETDLVTLFPEIAKEWNYEKNKGVPSEYTAYSNKKVWWVCTYRHPYQAVISHRTGRGDSCPYCSNKRVLIGNNDLEMWCRQNNPKLLLEWNYDKNDKAPNEFLSQSNRKVWWKCKAGHEWRAVISDRVNYRTTCPYCNGKRAIPRGTDLVTLFPEIAKEWNYEKNVGEPAEYTAKSGKKVWWKCKKGHEWETTVIHRTGRGDGCPYCSGRNAIPGETDLVTLFPEIAKEWNYEKNVDEPAEYTAKSGKKVWWKCKEGHAWQTRIYLRTINGYGCPYCAGQLVVVGKNDLETWCKNTNSNLLAEWDFETNKLLPSEYKEHSNIKVSWRCNNHHKWYASINERTGHKTKCPYCSGRKAIPGETDLVTLFPEIAKEWNYEKNVSEPAEYTAKSGKKVWWKCKKGHEWEAIVIHRTKQKSGCPYCSGRYAIAGENDLETLYPEIVKEWDYEKNKGLPSEYTAYSNKKVWWKCLQGHSYRSIVSQRTLKGTGCRLCHKNLS